MACDVVEPSCEQFGSAQECPICWDRITSRAQWRRFACSHGTCADCHAKLLEPPGKHSCCPLCRLSLVRRISLPGACLTVPRPESLSPIFWYLEPSLAFAAPVTEAAAETSERQPPETTEAPSVRPDSRLPQEATGIAAVMTDCDNGSSEASLDCFEERRADREETVVATNSAQALSVSAEWLAAIPVYSLEEVRAGHLEREQRHSRDRQQKAEAGE